MQRWLTSDEHVGHANILVYCNRPFHSLDHMHKELIDRHNAVVGDDDEVWHLGDFCLHDNSLGWYLKSLKGTHFLVCGNHDRCHKSRKQYEKWTRKYMQAGFGGVYHQVQLGGVTLCHFPYVGDHSSQDRFKEYRPTDRGGVLLHGHVHDYWKVRGRMVNVGVDVWDYRPIPFEFAVAQAEQ